MVVSLWVVERHRQEALSANSAHPPLAIAAKADAFIARPSDAIALLLDLAPAVPSQQGG